MAEIPPDIPASAAQAGFQAREAAKERDARRAGQAEIADRRIKTVDEAGGTVETSDSDVAIFADTEGHGSQGRAFEEEGQENQQDTQPGDAKGITKGEDGSFHIDLEA